MLFTRILFWTMLIVSSFALAAKFINQEQAERDAAHIALNPLTKGEFEDGREILTLTIDMKSIECAEPAPSRDSVEVGLSFTQISSCTASPEQHPQWKHSCFNYKDRLVCLDGKISITLSSTDIGTKVVKGKDL